MCVRKYAKCWGYKIELGTFFKEFNWKDISVNGHEVQRCLMNIKASFDKCQGSSNCDEEMEIHLLPNIYITKILYILSNIRVICKLTNTQSQRWRRP